MVERSPRSSKDIGELSEVEKKILRILQENCKISYEEIGRIVGLSKTSVYSKIKKLTEKGYIKKFVAIIDGEKLGYKTVAWLGISVEPDLIHQVAEKIAGYDETQVVFITIGDHDVLFNVVVRDSQELADFINKKIKTIEGVKLETRMDISYVVNILKWSYKFNI